MVIDLFLWWELNFCVQQPSFAIYIEFCELLDVEADKNKLWISWNTVLQKKCWGIIENSAKH